MVKKSVNEIVTVYQIVNNAKLSKMEDAEKIAFVKIARQLKKNSVDFEDFLKEAQSRLKPQDLDEIVMKIQNKESLSIEEQGIINKYNANVADCVKDELDKLVEMNFEPLSEESLQRFIASNDFSVNEIISISDVISI